MKVVILAGGLGTRISEESHLVPKPMIEIGGKPILWHIMKHYSGYGHTNFIICAGYRQDVIKEYFANYFIHAANVTFDLSDNSVTVHYNHSEPWRVTVIDTGLNTMTGGRMKRVEKYIGGERFFLTYGDGVADVDISRLLSRHKECGRVCTLTTVNAAQRFGVLDINNGLVSRFSEKNEVDGNLINAGFMVCEPAVFNYIKGDADSFEQEPMRAMVRDGQLAAYFHGGFWQCMDTQREKQGLEELWCAGKAPWKTWDRE
jgi:glucose-1-phosphate cytidylyltransferase